MTAKTGMTLDSRRGKYSNFLSFRDMPGFASREEAVAALDVVRKLGTKGIEEKAVTAAVNEARQAASEMGAALFLERNISLEVPVIRSAAEVDLEAGFETLRAAKGPEQVRAALDFYESLGTKHAKPDGSPNNTANYGVACGNRRISSLSRESPRGVGRVRGGARVRTRGVKKPTRFAT